MRKKLVFFSILAVPFVVVGFVFNFFIKKEKLSNVAEVNFFQKAYADDPATWVFNTDLVGGGGGCEGAGCCGSI